jgi:hypothetical protein
MKNLALLSLAALLFLDYGCNSSTEPTPPPNAGRVTVNSKSAGFSFSQAKVIPFPPPSSLLPDLAVLVQTDDMGAILGVFFSTSDLRPAFQLVRQSSTADSARAFFEALAVVPDAPFQDLAIPVRAHQIWAVKTREDKYAKILVLNTVAYDDSTNPSAPTPYGEATFDWVLQPDGSRQF